MDGAGAWAAIWYVAKDASSGVLLAFRLASNEASRVFPLSGLSPGKEYRASFFSAASQSDTTGEALARGLTVEIPGRFHSELVLVEAG
jgi:hypothetical protein